jgi:ubiquitin-conjugating enzyme E2 Z
MRGVLYRQIPKMAVKRVSADILELQKEIYSESGIYYSADESNICEGYGLVFGPAGTPYEMCPMFYKATVPKTYPFDPPSLKFLTYDGKTRFHPNMYVEGKVCLSILHTWEGPKWASTMRLSTIFVTLQSLMDTNPLNHEPGYSQKDTLYHKAYSVYIEYACMRYILYCLEQLDIGSSELCISTFASTLKDWRSKMLESVEKRLEGKTDVESLNLPYSMYGNCKYSDLRQRLIKLKARKE